MPAKTTNETYFLDLPFLDLFVLDLLSLDSHYLGLLLQTYFSRLALFRPTFFRLTLPPIQ